MNETPDLTETGCDCHGWVLADGTPAPCPNETARSLGIPTSDTLSFVIDSSGRLRTPESGTDR